ncbi:HlyD family secretion protein [Asticcacaulis sp. W401b]|uniref:HlyD family secretion protein n=1 Tax=Asticcacaulis sp. W401b TaxID=3388666 RepID=UPI0039707011
MSTTTKTATESDVRPVTWLPPVRPLHLTALSLVAGAAGILSLLYAWQLPPFGGAVEITDNAYVRGRTTVIAPQVSGYVTAVEVSDYQPVGRNAVLVRIDDRIYRQRVAQAEANLEAQQATLANNRQSLHSRQAALSGQTASVANAQAQLAKARADMARADDLVRDGSISQREHDQTLAALKQAQAAVDQAQAGNRISQEDIRTVEVSREGLEANVKAAEAQLRLAQVDLDNTLIRAPENGRASEVGVRVGQYVTNGNPLVSIVPAERWIIANYKEAQTTRIRPGQSATLKVDALGGAVLNGHVEALSPATGSEFSAVKPDNGTGNFVKVPQRIGVRIRIDPGQAEAARLRPGMSVETRIRTRG